MRVLHLIPGNLYGGVESFLSLLARRTDLTFGTEHHFAICFEGRLARELEASGAIVHRLGHIRASRPWTVLRGRRNLSQLLRAHRFDVAVCHSCWPQAMFGPVLKRHRVANVFYLHGPINRLSWVDHLAARTSPTRMIAVSRHTLSTGRRIFPKLHASVLHYPLPIEKTHRVPRESDDVTLLQVSRMEPLKGHFQLIDALARLKDLHGWSLKIAGGAQRPSEQEYLLGLLAHVAASDLTNRVQFLGERNDVPQLLASADVFCQANSGPEGFSVAFMEAFASRLPIVTTAIGGATELIDDTCGVLAPAGDVQAIADGIRSLITDRAHRERLGLAGEKRVRELCDPTARFADLHRLLKSAA